MIEALSIVAAYLLGSIPFGVMIARAKGVDIFSAGSGNSGATNVGRVLGKAFGVAVFVLDYAKGAIPAGFASHWRGSVDVVAVVIGLAAVVGHMFPVFLKFRGGKGVATGAGVVSMLLPWPFVAGALAFVMTIWASATMSIASINAALMLAMTQISMNPTLNPATVLAALVGVLVVVKHRSNIARLRDGTENRLRSLTRFRSATAAMHALALGIWTGAGLFFSFGVAPSLFASFDQFVKEPPPWFHIADEPADLGSRLAGTAVAPLFPNYFAVAVVMGLIATGSAIGWAVTATGRRNRWRAGLLVAALLLVFVGWPVSQHVRTLRHDRWSNDATIANAAKAAFGPWHGISLGLNLVSLALLVPALALAAYPPTNDEYR